MSVTAAEEFRSYRGGGGGISKTIPRHVLERIEEPAVAECNLDRIYMRHFRSLFSIEAIITSS